MHEPNDPRPAGLGDLQQVDPGGESGHTLEDPVTPGLQFDTENQTNLALQAELEAEVFLRDNVSVSASHGIAFASFNPGFGADSESSFGTIGHNFTNIGFHVYFLGTRK